MNIDEVKKIDLGPNEKLILKINGAISREKITSIQRACDGFLGLNKVAVFASEMSMDITKVSESITDEWGRTLGAYL